MEIKTKIKKWDPLKFKNFCTTKEKINKMLNSSKTKKPINKWVENLNRHFSKEGMQMAKRHTKKMFNIADY